MKSVYRIISVDWVLASWCMKIFVYCQANVFNMFMLWCSFRLPETLERLASQLELVYNASGGKKINIISHSMGGLLVKCFMCLHSDVSINIFMFLDLFLFSFSISYLPFHGFIVISFFILSQGKGEGRDSN